MSMAAQKAAMMQNMPQSLVLLWSIGDVTSIAG